MPYRVVCMGTPDFGVPSFEALIQDPRFDVVLFVSQPAKPQGRKGEVKPTPVMALAEQYAIPCITPSSLKSEEVLSKLEETQADFFVVIAYGKIVSQRVLDMPSIAAINVHGSLLPRHRGASPIQASLLAGDEKLGISIMRMTAGMDEGPFYSKHSISNATSLTAGEAFERLSALSAEVLPQALCDIAEGQEEVAQNEELATYCGKLRKEEGELDWELSADEILRRWQAYTPWPSVYTFLEGKRVKLLQLEHSDRKGLLPGHLEEHEGKLYVGTGSAPLCIVRLQKEGGKAMTARDFLAGLQIAPHELVFRPQSS